EGEGLVWIQVEAGSLRLLDWPDLPFGPEDGPLLIGPRMWLKVASATARLTVRPLSTAQSCSALAEGLDTLHRYFNAFLKRLGEEEEQLELARRRTSQELREMESAEALEELTRLLHPAERFARRPTPLLTALSAVGAVLGIQIRPPAESEDLSRATDPV